MGRKDEEKRRGMGSSHTSGDTRTSKIPFGNFRFARIELTAEERDDLRDWLGGQPKRFGDLDSLLDKGYTIKIGRTDDFKTVQISLSQPFRDGENAGCILTARGRDTDAAVGCLTYKLNVILQGNPWAQVEAERGGFYDDGLG